MSAQEIILALAPLTFVHYLHNEVDRIIIFSYDCTFMRRLRQKRW